MDLLLKTPLNPACLKLIQEIAAFQECWRLSAETKQEFYTQLKKTTIITSAGASTRIEGATLTDEEIQKKLVGLKIQKITDRDEAEVAGYIDCKKYIFENFGDLEISEYSIRSLHQMMMVYLASDVIPLTQRGAYKNITNSVVRVDHATGEQEVVFRTTPPGPQTEAAMRKLVEDFNYYINDINFFDLEVIAAFVVKFLAIHPFRDGNGRMSRLLTDLCLLKKGYHFCMYSSHEKVIEDSKEQYYVALRQTQSRISDKPDINPWFFYFLKVLARQTQYLNDGLTPKKSGTLTKYEDIVINTMQKNGVVTIGFLARETDIKLVTLKAILSRLKKKGLIVMEGERKASRYRIKDSN